jgi:predicted amidohydrolase YtcJ
VIANIQAYWAAPHDYHEQMNSSSLGAERYATLFPYRSLADVGARLVASSDWPVSTHEPLQAIEVGVTRQVPDSNWPTVLNEAERLALETMIEAYTINGAYFMRQESIVGSIEVGKYADLVVLDRNLFEIPTNQIAET